MDGFAASLRRFTSSKRTFVEHVPMPIVAIMPAASRAPSSGAAQGMADVTTGGD